MPYPLAFAVPYRKKPLGNGGGGSVVDEEVSLVLETVNKIGRWLRQIAKEINSSAESP